MCQCSTRHSFACQIKECKVTPICHRALDLRPEGLVPIIFKTGVIIRDTQKEHVFIILCGSARGMWRKQVRRHLCVCVCVVK